LTGLTFAIWGLAFKPNTDDVREAPSLIVIKNLLLRGARVKAYDPVAIEQARSALVVDMRDESQYLKNISYVGSSDEAIFGADALLILTEWRSFKSPNFIDMGMRLNKKVIFDGRNLYDPLTLSNIGFEYHGIGRNNVGGIGNKNLIQDSNSDVYDAVNFIDSSVASPLLN